MRVEERDNFVKDTSQLVIPPKMMVIWEPNPGGRTAVKANRINGDRTRKIVLVDGAYAGRVPNPGEKWLCEFVREVNPTSQRHGSILVRPERQELVRDFPGVWMPEDVKRQLSILLQTPGKNAFMKGPAGCGKTTIAAAIALGLNWEFWKIEGNTVKRYSQMLSRIMPDEKDGRLAFRTVDSSLALLIKAARDNPHKTFLAMVDEYTRMDIDARDIMLGVIEGKERMLPLPNGECLEVPSNIVWMAAGNFGDRFTVKDMDEANLSRWVVLKIWYMPLEEERKLLLGRYPHCPAEDLTKALKVINILRDRTKVSGAQRIGKAVSTREADSVAMFLAAGETLKAALTTAVLNQFDGEPDQKGSESAKAAEVIENEVKN
jgi:MoxR-like ATPase